jgi:hypothetical protein
MLNNGIVCRKLISFEIGFEMKYALCAEEKRSKERLPTTQCRGEC